MGTVYQSKNFKKFEKLKNDTTLVLWRQLLLLVEQSYAELEESLSKEDCSYPRFRLLFILYFEAPFSAAKLASRLRVTRSNLSTFIKRLEADGLIKACPLVSTKTRPLYVLTPQGTDYTEGLMSFHFSNVKKLPIFKAKKSIQGLKAFLSLTE
jgi:DNA-binding MarR family transcriptional regulator